MDYIKKLFLNAHNKPCLCLVLGALGFLLCLVLFVINQFTHIDFDVELFKYVFAACSTMVMVKSTADTVKGKREE